MNHEGYMRRCLELAGLGEGYTHPNPMVGSVIVEGGEVIGEGWHRRAGEPHAEVNAIDSVKDRSRLKSATLYVNLEPCSHFGRTPPCSDRIIAEGIPNVVIGTTDPHVAVAGKGIEKLRESGVTVIQDILKEECLRINRAFFTYHREKRPYVTLKWARSADEFIAPEEHNRVPGEPSWITGHRSKQLVHRLRAQADAILVGGKTVVADDPGLTTRLWPGNDPQRIIWTQRPIDQKNKVMKDGHSTWVVGPHAADYGYSEPIEGWNSFTAIELLHELFEKGIVHLMVEGGAKTIERFTAEDLWDEAYILTGSREFGTGIESPSLRNAVLRETHSVEGDLWQRFTRR